MFSPRRTSKVLISISNRIDSTTDFGILLRLYSWSFIVGVALLDMASSFDDFMSTFREHIEGVAVLS